MNKFYECMTFEEATNYKKAVIALHKDSSNHLEELANGASVVSDEIKATKEWQEAVENFDKSFEELTEFGTWYVNKFVKCK